MPKLLQRILRRTVYRNKPNLMSLDDPYDTMQKLFGNQQVRGIIDAGASNGHVSQRLLKRFPQAKAYLFEPNPAYASKLHALAEEDSRISPQLMALSSEPGTMTLNITHQPGRTSLLDPQPTEAENDEQQKLIASRTPVPVVTIDQWQQEHDPRPIDLVKMDIQAGEYEALRGGAQTLRQKVSMVYAETFFSPRYRDGPLFGQIHHLLRTMGFELYNFYNPRSDDRGKLLWAHALFIHPENLSGHQTAGA